jgi:hypothetical protein
VNALSSSELARMQAANESAMWDTGHRLIYDGTAKDRYNKPAAKWTEDATDVACGYSAKSREVMEGTQVVLTDGSLRLPIATVMVNTDRWKLTKRYGVALAVPLVFDILGALAPGPLGLVVNLRLVTDGSST